MTTSNDATTSVREYSAMTVIVWGDHSDETAEAVKLRLQVDAEDKSDLFPDMYKVDVLDHADMDPRDPDNVEIAEDLADRARTCEACREFHTLFTFIARGGSSRAYYSLRFLMQIHESECWSGNIWGVP